MIDYMRVMAILKKTLINRTKASDVNIKYMTAEEILVMIAQIESEMLLGIENDTCGLPFADPEVE